MSKNLERAGAVIHRMGIPTLFAGIVFRSRQEAKWASFFTALRLRWDYEPGDLAGYIPDFDVRFGKKPLLLEVKGTDEDIALAKSKIEVSGWPGDIAIVVSAECPVIGEIYEPDTGWDRAIMGMCVACHVPTICSEAGRWGCRNCGADSRQLWWAWSPRAAWSAACNETQWRKPA